jgi:hypothetical protein
MLVARLQREPWTFPPEVLRLRPLAWFQTRNQQMSWLQKPKKNVQHLASLQQRGFLEGVMRVVWDDPTAAVPDEVAHLEDLKDPQISKPLCLPKEIKVQGSREQWLQQIKTQSGWSRIIANDAVWEVDMRWWTEAPLWRQYSLAISDRLGPVRLFHEPLTGRWFRH